MIAPNASSNSRITSTGIADPPEMHMRSVDTSAPARSGWLSIAWYLVGTPPNSVTRPRAMISSPFAGSKPGASLRRPGAGVREVELDLAALEQHVHRHHDAARPQHAVVDDAEVRDVRQHDPDAVARPHAALLQQPRDPRGALVEHRVIHHRVVELERG